VAGVTRRRLLQAGAATAVVGAAGAVGWAAAPDGFKYRLGEQLGLNPDPYVPDVPEGTIRIEDVSSTTMGDVRLFTAVPDGFGDGAGLPVLVVLHGSSATVEDFAEFGFGRFVTAAARDGFPLVLAGTDDGPSGWLAGGGVDPEAMLRDEMPAWLAARGFDAGRRALWGWSRGGYGALHFATTAPTWGRALALFSPALGEDDPLFGDVGRLGQLPVGLWCGEDDAFYPACRTLADALPQPPQVDTSGDGGHTRQYWNDQTLPMLRWVGGHLA
jgi:hypothetical protein